MELHAPSPSTDLRRPACLNPCSGRNTANVVSDVAGATREKGSEVVDDAARNVEKGAQKVQDKVSSQGKRVGCGHRQPGCCLSGLQPMCVVVRSACAANRTTQLCHLRALILYKLPAQLPSQLKVMQNMYLCLDPALHDSHHLQAEQTRDDARGAARDTERDIKHATHKAGDNVERATDKAGRNVEHAADKAGHNVEKGADKAGRKVQEGAQYVQDKIDDARRS
jgi:hypothetical protein